MCYSNTLSIYRVNDIICNLCNIFFIQSFIIYTYISLKDIVDTVLDTVDAILLNAVFCVWVFDEPQSTLRQPDRGRLKPFWLLPEALRF